ncbi:hypothetical protein V8F20_007295 [Naviculisporaceae sp. PSN 640]
MPPFEFRRAWPPPEGLQLRGQLEDMVPRAGMIYYPHPNKKITGSYPGDKRIAYNLLVNRVDKWNKAEVQAAISEIFIAAAEYVSGFLSSSGNVELMGAVTFLQKLRSYFKPKINTQFMWTRFLSLRTWIGFFLCIRSARLRWIKNPREPYDPEQASSVAKAVDRFEAAQSANASNIRIEWGGREMLMYLRKAAKEGCGWADPKDDDMTAQMNALGADDDNHQKDVEMVVECAATKTTEKDLALIMKQLEEFGLDADKESFEDMFGKLSIGSN